MHIIESIIIRAVQLASMLFFTFAVFVYVGAAVIIPLAALFAVVSILSGIGFNGIIATIISIPALIWLMSKMHKIPNLTSTLVDTGWALVRSGADNFKIFDDIAKRHKGNDTSSVTTEN